MKRGSADVYLDMPAETAWNALVSTDRREWYFRLTAEGDFDTGRTVRWLDVRGEPAEESEIIESSAPLRLTMRTHFLFAPAFAEQPAHTVAWELTPDGAGCRVRMSWEAGEITGGLLASEAQNILDGLRLEHDPTAQAELARLPQIGEIEMHQASSLTKAACGIGSLSGIARDCKLVAWRAFSSCLAPVLRLAR